MSRYVTYNSNSTSGSVSNYYNMDREWSNTFDWFRHMGRSIKKHKRLTQTELRKMRGENPEAKEGKITWITTP